MKITYFEPKTLKEISNCNSTMAGLSALAAIFPLHSEFNAYVSNVHNVPQLRFFVIVNNAKNIEHFAKLRRATSPDVAFKCMRMPPEGYVFALRMGESTMVRAVRLPTMCVTKTREVYFPDIGRNYVIPEREVEMYHLPYELRKAPGVAISCQLKGVNDDVTILPGNMRSIIRGLLYRNVQLRVDGYMGGSLRVQLLNVPLNELVQWTYELGDEEHDFEYALKHVRLDGSKFNDEAGTKNNKNDEETFNENNGGGGGGGGGGIGIDENKIESSNEKIEIKIDCGGGGDEPLFIDEDSNGEKTDAFIDVPLDGIANITPLIENSTSSLSIWHSCSSTDSWLSPLNSTIILKDQSKNPSIIADDDDEESAITVNMNSNVAIADKDSEMKNENKRPLLGCLFKQLRPILGSVGVSWSDTAWQRDTLPALMLVDNRQLRFNFSRDELLTITPTFIGQLERFFGLVHHRGRCYMQHMWTDDEVPWRTRYLGKRAPYIFDVVLAKHSGDCKWYRAKVIDIDIKQHRVRVFYVDYGGVEYVDLWNLADLSRSISALPFQAVLFRFYDLFDGTTTKAEREYGVHYLRTLLLKKTLTVRVTNYRYNEITICLDDPNFTHLPATLIRKGLMKHYMDM